MAASFVVGMLAETEFDPPWSWPTDITVEAVRSETGEAVDDIWIRTSASGRAYVQAKRSLTLDEPTTSEFGKTICQFVDQYLNCRDGAEGREPLDPARDRLVLAVGVDSSASVRQHLRAILEPRSSTDADRPADNEPNPERQAHARNVTVGHITQAFRKRTGANPAETDVQRLLALMRVSVHDFADDGYSEREALRYLRTSVVADTARTRDAWNALCRAVADDTARRSGMSRHEAQAVLRRESIALQAPRSYRDDIVELIAHTKTTVALLDALSDIPLRGGRAKIDRAIPAELARLAEHGSCVVVGDPGAGKSAAMFELINDLRSSGADVVALAADRLDSGSLGALRVELNLNRSVTEVLANWPTDRGFLIIDALDAPRGDKTQEALLDLIEAAQRQAADWTIVVCIRRFDLRYNARVRNLFPTRATPPPGYADPEFARVNHLSVALLSQVELDQLEQLAPGVHAFLVAATPDLRELVRVPFNLRLLAQLLDAQVDPRELHPIRTQLDLVDAYWEHRVRTPIGRADPREDVLRATCERIISSRSMVVPRADVPTDPALIELLSAQLLVESTVPGGAVDGSRLAFGHHLMFDFATARLLLRRRTADVVAMLAATRDLPILIRPSLELHLRWLWDLQTDHREFWELTFAIAERSDIAEIATLVATAVAAEMTRTLGDLAPLIDAATSPDIARQQLGERVLSHVLFSAQTFNLPLGGDNAGPWTALVASLTDA